MVVIALMLVGAGLSVGAITGNGPLAFAIVFAGLGFATAAFIQARRNR